MAARFIILAWEIPWMGKLVSYCPWGHKNVRNNLVTKKQQKQGIKLERKKIQAMQLQVKVGLWQMREKSPGLQHSLSLSRRC